MVRVPLEVLWDFDDLTNLKRQVLDRLGCTACTSGFDIRWKGAREFVVNPAKLKPARADRAVTGRLDLGVGLALMPGLVDDLDRVEGLVDCLEVEPQTFWWETGDPDEPFRLQADEVLALARRVDAVLAHGVSSPVGGSRPPHPHLARLFRETAHLLGARLASEHLAFNHAGPEDGEYTTAFFLPPRQTPAGVEVAAASIAALRDGLEVPFSVETPVNYLRPRPDEMDDGAYVAAVAERADCGILLDLHNIWANERNGRQDARAYVAQLPLDRVWEVHLAGGFDRGGYWLDAHSGTLHPDLLALAADVLPRLPQLRAVVYEIMPEFVEHDGRDLLRPDLEAVHRLVDALPRGTTRAPNEPQPPPEAAPDAPTRTRSSPPARPPGRTPSPGWRSGGRPRPGTRWPAPSPPTRRSGCCATSWARAARGGSCRACRSPSGCWSRPTAWPGSTPCSRPTRPPPNPRCGAPTRGGASPAGSRSRRPTGPWCWPPSPSTGPRSTACGPGAPSPPKSPSTRSRWSTPSTTTATPGTCRPAGTW